jgi:cell division protein FtsW
MSIFPTKGLTLPFVSYGGSSLLVCAAAMGVLLSISRRSAQTGNVRTSTDALPAEASAMLVTEAGFAPEQIAKGRKRAVEGLS